MFFSLLLGFLGWPGVSSAWTVDRLEGEVVHINHAFRKTPKVGDLVSVGDTVITEKGAMIRLKEDDSVLTIGANTKMNIRHQEKREKNLWQLYYGQFRTKLKGELATKTQFKLRTATAGVRGTEFFAESSDMGEALCTLEGIVQAETNDGEVFQVTAGKGLFLAEGKASKLESTSNDLVNRWIAQTSFDPVEASFSSENYQNNRLHPLEDISVFWGLDFHAFYCDRFNGDFNSETSDPNINCLRSSLSPFLKAGKDLSVTIRPKISAWESNGPIWLDRVPGLISQSRRSLTLAEFHGDYVAKDWNVTVGLQEMEWNDGTLLSSAQYSNEPISHMAIRSVFSSPLGEIELLGAKGFKNLQPLEGHTHINLLGGKIGAPNENFFLLHADYGLREAGQSHLYFGHQVLNGGFYQKKYWRGLDSKISVVAQHHFVHIDSGGNSDSVNSLMGDLELGYSYWPKNPARISLRYLRAGKNFAPLFEDYYRLGWAGQVQARANLEQMRLKSEWTLGHRKWLSIEGLRHTQVASGTLVNHLVTSEDFVLLGHEADLIYKQRAFDRLTFQVGAWIFAPDAISERKSVSYGTLAIADFAL